MDCEKHSVVCLALAVIAEQTTPETKITDPKDAQAFLQLKLAPEKREVFGVLFLDSQHHVIEYESLFKGNINKCSVHLRIIVQRCLELNAASIIIAHNHPSGDPKPSEKDIQITSQIIKVLTLIDVRVLDHIIIGKSECLSLAENQLLSQP